MPDSLAHLAHLQRPFCLLGKHLQLWPLEYGPHPEHGSVCHNHLPRIPLAPPRQSPWLPAVCPRSFPCPRLLQLQLNQASRSQASPKYWAGAVTLGLAHLSPGSYRQMWATRLQATLAPF